MIPSHLLSSVVLLSCVAAAIADINFKNCLGPIDLGPYPDDGIFPNVCVLNHHFHEREHAWSFHNSIIRNTNFTKCVMHDTLNAKQNYGRATWENVIFKHCSFRSAPQITFDNTFFRSVLFDSCIFDKSTSILFSEFGFENVEFRNCTFHAKVVAQLGTIRRLIFSNSTFGSRRVASADGGDVEFSQVTVNRFHIMDSVSKGEFRFQEASVEDLEVVNSEVDSLHCHEKLIVGKKPKKQSQFNDTMIIDSSLTDGLYWGDCTIRGLEMQNISVRNVIDFSSSFISRLAVINVTSLSNETCSNFDLSSAVVRGNQLKGIETTKGTFEKTVFETYMKFDNFSIANTTFELTKTVFASEVINGECCTVGCVARGCLCDVPVEPETSCPAGDGIVNTNIDDSCFPGDALVSVVKPLGVVVQKTMTDLRYGDPVLYGHQMRASPVFFFGHKSRSKSATFRVLTVVCNRTGAEAELVLSDGHLLPVQGRGLRPARSVSTSDVVHGADGGLRIVTKVRLEVRKGVFAPTTLNGAMAVNGIIVSCYTDVVPAWVAHAALAPLRGIFYVGGVPRKVLERFSFLHHRSAAPVVRSMVQLMDRLSTGFVHL